MPLVLESNRRNLVRACVMVAIVVPFAWALLPTSMETSTASRDLKSIELTHAWILGIARVFALSALMLAILSARLLKSRRPLHAFWLSFTVGIVTSLAVNPSGLLLPWVQLNLLNAPAGQQFLLAKSSLLQSQRLALARVRDVGWITTKADVVGVTNLDLPVRYVSIVRPSPTHSEGRGQLKLSSDKNWILACWSPNTCWLALRLSDDTFFGHSGFFGCSRDIEDVSPFLLIGPQDTLDPHDLQHLREDNVGFPDPQALQEDRANPNPAVRAAVAPLLAK